MSTDTVDLEALESESLVLVHLAKGGPVQMRFRPASQPASKIQAALENATRCPWLTPNMLFHPYISNRGPRPRYETGWWRSGMTEAAQRAHAGTSLKDISRLREDHSGGGQ